MSGQQRELSLEIEQATRLQSNLKADPVAFDQPPFVPGMLILADRICT